MSIDEIYEQLLVVQHVKLTAAHIAVCKEKFDENRILFSLKQIESGYQLFRKRNKDKGCFPEDSFRRFCFMRWSKGGTNIQNATQVLQNATQVFVAMRWRIDPAWKTE